jgi:spore maturation protein CgeB
VKFLILNTDYSDFIGWLYAQHPGLEEQPYEEQRRVRMDNLFGTADFYSANLRKLGYEGWDVIANIEPMQKQWAREHGFKYESTRWRVRLRRGIVPWPYREHNREWLYPILAAQIEAYRPDVLFSMAMETVGSGFLRSVKGYYRLAIGQHAATPLYQDISAYDLVLSSLPNQVDYFRQSGLKSELFKLGFEPRILEELTNGPKCYDLVFVGGLGGIHQDGTETLSRLAERFPVTVWGYGLENLAESSPLRQCYRGPIWGIGMYQALRDSQIVFNRHSNLADRHFANNMRLYEATGVGTLLLTDYKQNLADMFGPGREVIAYRDANECVELAEHYLTREDEREAIARAGQQRTLSEHTWYHRMQELVEIVRKYL